MEQRPPDVWAEGHAYERYMGRWSRQVAEVFVARLGAPSGLRWLDIGCGTGALTLALAARGRPRGGGGVEGVARWLGAARGAAPGAGRVGGGAAGAAAG
ncbi:SAM-dependent methyltransferase, partial [Streptomyces sp. NPDC001581]